MSNFASRSSPDQNALFRNPVSAMRHPAFFRDLPVVLREHAPDFKQRHVVVFPRQIVPQRIQQSRQQTRPQHVHVAAQRILQRHRSCARELRARVGNQRLPLRFIQAQPGQNPPRLRQLVIHRVECVRADRAARRRGAECCPRRTSARFPRSNPPRASNPRGNVGVTTMQYSRGIFHRHFQPELPQIIHVLRRAKFALPAGRKPCDGAA